MKKFTLISAALLLCSGASLAGNVTALRVVLADDTSEVYRLDEKPQITFSGSEMKIESQALSTSYERTEVKAMDFTEVSSVGTIPSVEVTYTLHDNQFSCPGHAITVYSLAGMQVAAGIDSVSLTNLAAGIYIINVNQKSIKVIKR